MMIAVIFFIFASAMLVLGLTGPAAREYHAVTASLVSRQSHILGESGVEDAYYRLSNGMNFISGTSISTTEGTAVTTLTDLGAGLKELLGTGDVLGSQHQMRVEISAGTGTAFPYAIEADDGGIDLSGTGTITGNVHANGTIHGTEDISITGIATAGAMSDDTPGVITGDDASHLLHIGVGGIANAYASVINYADVTGVMYCTSSTGSSSSCVSAPDPAYEDLPISSEDISGWKDDAETGGTISGNYTATAPGTILGPKKIDGDLTVPTGSTLTLSGTLWVTGDVTVSGTGSIILSSSYGGDSGMVIADGTITAGSTATVQGSGTTGSFLMLLSTKTGSAISYGGSGEGILYAPAGTVALTGGAIARSVIGMTVTIAGTSSILYDDPLGSVVFHSGVIGAPSLLSWKQIR